MWGGQIYRYEYHNIPVCFLFSFFPLHTRQNFFFFQRCCRLPSMHFRALPRPVSLGGEKGQRYPAFNTWVRSPLPLAKVFLPSALHLANRKGPKSTTFHLIAELPQFTNRKSSFPSLIHCIFLLRSAAISKAFTDTIDSSNNVWNYCGYPCGS